MMENGPPLLCGSAPPSKRCACSSLPPRILLSLFFLEVVHLEETGPEMDLPVLNHAVVHSILLVLAPGEVLEITI